MTHYRVLDRRNNYIGDVEIPLGEHYECLIINGIPYVTVAASQLGSEMMYREATVSTVIEMRKRHE